MKLTKMKKDKKKPEEAMKKKAPVKKKKTGQNIKSKPEQKLRVLILEDNPSDAELMERQLRRDRIAFTAQRAETRAGFTKALRNFQPDLVLADYKLPKFDALQALDLRNKTAPFTPFIIVTGTISEEIAVKCMKQGADDYLLKDRLARLSESVRHALTTHRLQSEKMEAEKSLRSNELLYRAFINSSSDMAFLKDDKFRHLLANRELCRFYKKAEKEIIGKTDAELMDKSAAARCRRTDRQALTGNRVHVSEETVGNLTFETRKFPVKLTNGRIGVGGYIRDITERKRNEEALLAAAARWRTTFDAMNDAVCLLDGQGIVRQCNRAMSHLLELPFNQIIGRDSLDMICGKEKRKSCAFTRMMKTRQRIEEETFWRGYWFHVSVDPVIGPAGKFVGAVHIMTDITAAKNAKEALRESEEHFRGLYENAHIGMYRTTPDGRILMANPALIRMLGYGSFAELAERNLQKEGFEPDYPRREFRRQVERVGNITGLEANWHKKDGTTIFVRESARVVRDAEATIVFYDGTVEDINDRKQAEIQALRNEARLRSIVDILQHSSGSIQEFLDYALNQAIQLTESKIGYIYFYSEDERRFTLNTWSREVMKECAVRDPKSVYELERTGLWGEAVRQRRPILVNDFQADHPHKKGYPEGHVHLQRFLTVPVFSEQRIVAVVGVANKNADYNDSDVLQLTLLMDAVWKSVQLKKGMDSLQRSENLLNKIFDTLPVGLWLADGSGKLVRSNAAGRAIWGAEPLVGSEKYGVFKARRLPAGKEIAPDDWALAHSIRDKVAITDEMLEIDAFDGTKKTILNYTAPVLDPSGNVEAAVVVNLDISERQHIEAELKESENRYRNHFENSSEFYFTLDLKGNFVDVNKAAESLTGHAKSELLKMNFMDYTPKRDHRKLFLTLAKVYKTGEPIQNLLIEAIIKDKSIKFFETNFSLLKDGERIIGIQGSSKDITERKRVEEQIHASLREKEVLLKEIHHRVKNNLQVISGLLTLQAQQINDKRLQHIIKDSQNRIWTMALIHQTLYQSGNLADIDMADYFRSLVGNLLSAHVQVAMPPTIRFDLFPLRLGIDKAIPLALITNELVTNVMKHAFADGRPGEIRISLQERRGTSPIGDKSRRAPTDLDSPPTYELAIADNGAGLPSGFDLENQKSLGLQLVSMLTKQLDGTLAFESDGGTTIRIAFKNEKKEN